MNFKDLQYEKVKFPLTDKELAAFYKALNKIDFGYFEQCLDASCIYEEDLEKIALVKHMLEQFNDVIRLRLMWLEDRCGVVLPCDEDSMDNILEKYYNL
jgi:hypothetical protein